MRISSAGVVELAQGQIKFPATQVPSADPNTLDDYEEGTFNFGISFGGVDTGITYTDRTGAYTKIGNKVTVTGAIVLSSKGSATGSARLTGLPFTVFNNLKNFSAISLWYSGVSFVGQFQGYGEVNTTRVPLEQINESGTASSLADTNFANTSSIIIQLTYFVS
jgi:hypothetical protein